MVIKFKLNLKLEDNPLIKQLTDIILNWGIKNSPIS